jgi:putative ABC transport system ATP-binding protein
MESTIVECENVVKTYRQGKVEVRALSGVSLAIAGGEFIALAGPSGSGKTTLLNLIGGLDTPDSGRIRVAGNDYRALSSGETAELRLHHIGFIFQAYNLIPVLSALENVEYVMLLQGVPAEQRRERAGAILDEVGLQDMHHRRPAELSGGQQQRVAVARAIVSAPSIVLADEPTANLDSKTGESLLRLMRRMNRDHRITFVFSTHDKMVMDHADRLVMLRDGRIDEDINKAA